ncbi:MAG: TauD/TfdA family dioxygenase, partial [Pseudomonadota bacterium]
MKVTSLHPLFVAQITDIDICRPLDSETFEPLRDAFDQHSVLIFPDQPLTNETQIAFSEHFGALEVMQKGALGAATVLAGISNVDPQTDEVL